LRAEFLSGQRPHYVRFWPSADIGLCSGNVPILPHSEESGHGRLHCEMSAKGQSEDPRPRPHVGASLAGGRAVKTGRTLTLAQAEVFAKTGGQEKPIAVLTTAFMAVKGRNTINS